MDKPSSPLSPHYQLQQQPQVIVQYQEQHPQFGQAGVQYIYVQAPPPQTIPDLDEIEAKTLNVSYAVLTGFALAIGCGLGGIIVGIVELIVSHVIRSQAGLSLSFSTISTLSPNKDSFENKSKLEKIGNKLILVSEENNFESKCEAAHILILNTVDGTMFGLNRETGDILWEKKDESIIKTNSLIKQDNNENIYNFDEKTSNSKEMILNSGNEKVSEEKSFLIPDPVNGELYVYSTDENELTKMPITMKKLVGNHPAYFSDDGSIHSNKKTSKLIAIDPFTGIILATYGDDNDDSYFNLEKSNRKAVHLGKSEYTMSIDSKFSKRKIKYSEYTISDIGEDYDPEDLLGKSQVWFFVSY
ncbi:hypothetical protein HK099_003217 [Clydaea vesicula]|uniref:Uncharacterized protein n=1 Tax=Clydaea vesicula TaxID=447962 RepID=A0AAD5U4N3_9FUNG|nr:hypothetical protein HK099_003217 [Clydaea vesicula]